MALSALRLRRAVSLSSSLIKYQRLSSAVPSISSSPSLSPVTINSENHIRVVIQSHRIHLPFQSRQFRSSSLCLSSVRSSFRNNPDEEIGPDTILFEGCDYNHWLITMDFPKDPEPTREEKIEAYLQTLAKVVGSYEEAKKRMYSFSTTTYQGFQCLVTEEMSEKFKGLPGVVFVLPDSYIDPVNKEYGGDKYENGVITPRPPPAQYGRQGGRYGDRNRPYRQGNQAYGNQGPVHGDTRNFGQQQNPQMRPNYGPMGPGNRRDPLPMNKANFNQNEQGYNPQAGSDPSVPPEQRGYSGDNRNYAPPQGVNHGQGSGGNYGQGAGGNYGQGAGGNYGQQGAGGNYGQDAGGNYGQGAGRNYGQHAGGNYGQDAGRNYGQHAGGSYGQGTGGNYGQGAGGNFGQGAGGNFGQGAWGNNGQGTGGNQGQVLGTAPRQEAGLGYGQSNRGHGEEPRFSQMEQRNNTHGEQRNHAPTGQAGTDQGRY